MTDIRKSGAQLDAEAAGKPESEKVALSDLIATHRDLYRADLWIERLHAGGSHGKHTSGGPAGDLGAEEKTVVAQRMTQGGDEGWTGLPFSYRFGRFIANEHGYMFPWTRSYAAMRANCRRTHTRGHLEREAWRGSLCGELVARVIRRDYAFSRACYELGVYDPENGTDRAERVFRAALAHIEAKMEDLRQRAEPVQYRGEWPPAPEHRHHVVPGVHGEDCHQCHRINGVVVSTCPHPECRARRAA